jgi:hypothetical protein
LVENALAKALEALEAGNEEEGRAVIVGDTPVDDLHMLIEEQTFRVLILQPPLGGRDVGKVSFVKGRGKNGKGLRRARDTREDRVPQHSEPLDTDLRPRANSTAFL